MVEQIGADFGNGSDTAYTISTAGSEGFLNMLPSQSPARDPLDEADKVSTGISLSGSHPVSHDHGQWLYYRSLSYQWKRRRSRRRHVGNARCRTEPYNRVGSQVSTRVSFDSSAT